MRVLITGGHGSLGFQLLKELRRIGTYDSISCMDLYEEQPEYPYDSDNTACYDEFFYPTDLSVVRDMDIIIHLAENAHLLANPVEQINTNVLFTTALVSTAAAAGKRVIVPVWNEFRVGEVYVSPLEASLVWRAEIAQMFNRGNAVINLLYLSRIISPHDEGLKFGNLVKRFYNSVVSGHPATVYLSELTHNAQWCTDQMAVRSIVTDMTMRTRSQSFQQGYKASCHSIAEYMAWKMNVEYIEAADPKDKETMRIVYNPDSLENLTIKAAIDHCIEAWDEPREAA